MIAIDLSGKVALVTGGKNGIGEAIVETLHQAGATVVSADIGYTQRFQKKGERLATARLDVTSEEAVDDLVFRTLQAYQQIDILVNCAGISAMDYVVDSKTPDWERVLDVNAKGVYLTSRKVGKYLQQRGQGGRIVQIASQAGKNGYTAMGAYVASKHAVLGLTKTMAKELAKDNILVNAICPGIVETDMKRRERVDGGLIRKMSAAEIYAEDCSQVPLGRTASPEEVANVALFLASPLATYMTGQAINVTGGMTMH